MEGRLALVTGVSRRAGIGFAVARRLQADGHRVVAHAYSPHDAAQPWGADDLDAVRTALGTTVVETDLGDPDAPARLVITSGQHLGPMPGELPYAISKGAVHQMTRWLADALAEREVTVNAVNPGLVDTGWAAGALHEHVRAALAAGRWGTPEDVAAVVAWLVGPDARWVTGEVIDAEGGFRR